MQKLYKEQPPIKEEQDQFYRFMHEPVARDMERRHREYIFLQQSDVKTSRKEGITEGIIKGRIEDATRMKAMGFSLTDIIFVTELSKEEIDRLG
jgi:predicted transposase/invertase (TIGR01784 family)